MKAGYMKGQAGAGREILVCQRDGLLRSEQPVLLPVMAPRLQADITPEGHASLALWGSGTIASMTFSGWQGPYIYAPNHLVSSTGGVYVAQTEPVILLRGARLRSITPAIRCAWWGGKEVRQPVRVVGDRRVAETGWGVVVTERRGEDIAVAVGASPAEAQKALRLSNDAIVAEADAYVKRCDGLPEGDPEMRSMVLQGLHAALSSLRKDEHGAFAGLAAGQAYSAPARTYYRDGYWTHQALLRLCPEVLANQIDILATGVQETGEAPSGVILTGPAQSIAWDRARRSDPRIREEHLRPGDWWSDHFDSPLFFVLTIGDYVRATGDDAPLRKYWGRVAAIFRRYLSFATNGDSLPLKPRNDRDWADNVYRTGYVSYDIGLWVGALDVIAEFGVNIDAGVATLAKKHAARSRAMVDAALLQPAGWYADYAEPETGFAEDHLTLDSLTLLRFDAVSDGQSVKILEQVRNLLESRHNAVQPYGDWGTLCAFPPFKRREDTRAKSAFAFRYHNGADWPYLSGLYASERLRRGLDGWRYPLTRWWRSCLEQGWAGAVEYFSPPFGRGSLLQGWSSMPAATVLAYKARVLAGDNGADQ